MHFPQNMHRIVGTVENPANPDAKEKTHFAFNASQLSCPKDRGAPDARSEPIRIQALATARKAHCHTAPGAELSLRNTSNFRASNRRLPNGSSADEAPDSR